MRISKRHRRASGVVAFGLVVFGAGSASAATLRVGAGGVGARGVGAGSSPCPGATFSKIQAAIDAAAPGDEIAVCPGTYAEQLVIPAGKSGLVVRSTQPRAAEIEAPATMSDPGDIVRIHAARDVTLEGFTIAGPLPDALFCSLYPRAGVRVDWRSLCHDRDNHITEIRSRSAAYRGCQSGFAILVGSELEEEVGTARVEGNAIDAFQKTGILVDHAGSSAFVVGNQVTGDGPSVTIGQNGIQISYGAVAFVTDNWVSGEIYAPSPISAAILLYLPGRTSLLGNHVSDADYGIFTADAPAPQIEGNEVFACTADGIALDEETSGTTGARVEGNEAHDNGLDGIYVSRMSSQSVVRENRMFADGELDARDDSSGHGTAGTANTWVANHCKTDNHGGLLCERGARH